MRVLVTGGRGFIASYFRAHSQMKGFEFIYGTTGSASSNFERAVAPNYADALSIFGNEKIDAIVHIASKIPSSFATTTYEDAFQPNLQMMNNLYNLALEKRVSKFIYLSTFGSMSDSQKLDLKDFYTASKICGEHFCSMLEAQGVQTASLRISSPYGEFANKRTVLSLFVDRALKNQDITVHGTGSRSQNFVYAGDVVSAIEKCFERDVTGVYSILGAQNTTMIELAKTAIAVTGSQSKLIVGEKPDEQEGYNFPHRTDDKTRLELGFLPQVDLQTGMQRYVSWLKSATPNTVPAPR